jgi:nucleoside-diphosphate-sugar epimerase
MAFARIVDALAHDREFEVYGDGSQSRSFTFVADVVDATERALAAPDGIYNVGGGDEATLREAVELLEEIAGRELRVSYGPAQAGDMQRTKADTSRFENAVGWRSSTSLREGLTDHWRWASGKVTTR